MDKVVFYICVFVLGFVFFGYYLFGIFVIDLILLCRNVFFFFYYTYPGCYAWR